MTKVIADIEDIKRELWLRLRNEESIVWKTKEGDMIPIKNLSNIHLANIYKMLIKQEEANEELEEASEGYVEKDYLDNED